MSFTSSDFTGACLKRLIEFCIKVDTTKQTPDLINLVASETEYVVFCRKINDPKEKYQRRFTAICRTNRIDPNVIRKRVRLVASVLGVYRQVDYYKILGVPPDADTQAIKQAYRKKAQILHPDKAVGDDKDGAKFVKLHDAYMHLSDSRVRELYDRMRITAGRWIEGNEPKQRSATGGAAGRFLSWFFIVIGSMVIITYAFDFYQDGPLTFLGEHDPSNRTDGQHAVSTQIPDKPDARDGLTSPDNDDVEMAGLRKHFPEPNPMSMEPSEKLAGTEDQLMFFNPRREQLYWASEASRHDSLDDAIAALADMYHRTPEWVQSHMGEENALQAIHQKLSTQQAIEKILEEKTQIEEMPQDKALETADNQEPPPAAQAAEDEKGLEPAVRQDYKDEPAVAALTKAKSATFPEKVTSDKPATPAPKVQPIKKAASAGVTTHSNQKKPTVLEARASTYEKPVVVKSKKKAIMPTAGTNVVKQVRKVRPIKKTVSADKTLRPKQSKPTASRDSAGTFEKPVPAKPRKTKIMPTAKTHVLAQLKNDSIDYAGKKKRVAAFLKKYTKAYEQKDLNRFQSFFAEGALEQGRQFEEMLPTYRKTFRLVEALRYHIDMKSFAIDNMSKKICVEGAFTASYRLPEKKDWGSSSGSIRLELLDTPHGLLVCRLDYEMGD